MRSPRVSSDIVSEHEKNSSNKKASISSISCPNSPGHGQQSTVFTCWICRFQVEDPVTCANGHLFCRHCVNRWIEPKSYSSFIQQTQQQETTQHISNGNSAVSNSVIGISGGGAGVTKSCCPTCRIAMGAEDLRPILGAAEEVMLNGECGVDNEVAQHVVSRAKLRTHRFNFLRDIYESEISLLLSEIESLGEQLSRKERADRFVEASTQTHTRMASMEQLHNATDKLETAVKLSIDLKQHNDLLKKKNDDLEMERLSLLREISRSGGSGNNDERNINTTPQKIGGKYVFSTLEKTISDLQKENEQLKKALERQDEYIKELKTSGEQSEPRKELAKDVNPAPGTKLKVSKSTELDSWGNLSSSGKDVQSNVKIENRVKRVGEIALPSPLPCIQLGKKGFSKSETKRNQLNGDFTLRAVAEVKDSLERRNFEVEAPRRNALQSNKQTKRTLFTKEKEPSISVSSHHNSYQSKTQKAHGNLGSEVAIETCSSLNVDKSQELTISREIIDDKAVQVRDHQNKRSELTSKIPRPRSQSPNHSRCSSPSTSSASNAREVRRSPRKNQPSSNLSSDFGIQNDERSKIKKDSKGSSNGALLLDNALERERELVSKSAVFKTANQRAILKESREAGQDFASDSNSDVELTLELDNSIYSSSTSEKSGASNRNSTKNNQSSSSEILESNEVEDADKSDAFLNDLFCATEKRVESRNPSKLNKSSSSELESFELQPDDSSNGFTFTVSRNETSSTLFESQTSDKQQFYTSNVQSNSTTLKVQSQEVNGVKERSSNIKLSPGQRHSAEIYSPKSQIKDLPEPGNVKNSSSLAIDTQSLLGNLNQYQSTLSPITSQFNFNLNTKNDESSENHPKEKRSELPNNEPVSNIKRGESSKETNLQPSLAQSLSKFQDDVQSKGSSSSDFLKDIDETLAEITRLKGQSIHSLAATSASNAPKISTNQLQSTKEDLQKTPPKCYLDDLYTDEISSSNSPHNPTTPRSTTKRTFREMNLP